MQASRVARKAIFFLVISLGIMANWAADSAKAAEEAKNAGTESPADSAEPAKSAGFHFDLAALDINVYGLSYHPDRETVHREGLDNQVNPGLAVHYQFKESDLGVSWVEAGAYYDSGSNWAKFLGLGYQFKLGERWLVGGAVAAMHSDTYNHGVGFVGMFPLVTYDLGPVKLNAVYFPKVANYNEVAAFGFYVSLPVGKWLQ